MLKKARKPVSQFLCLVMVWQLLFSGLLPSAMAAAPSAVPSQISISLGGGAAAGKTAMAFNWVTDVSTQTSQIVYGKDHAAVEAGTASTKSASRVTPAGNNLTNFKPVNGFRVVLTDLEPGALYYYKVGAGSSYSGVASFTARDMESKDPYSFLFVPDTQGMNPSQFEYTKQMYAYLAENESDAAFMIHTGDIVEDAQTSDTWQYYYEAAQPLHRTMPFMATPGNHDSTDHDPMQEQFRTRFDYSSLRTPDGLSETAKGTIYAFDYGDALFVCLNSYPSYGSDPNYQSDMAIQWQFLADECAKTDKSWKIVFYHAASYDPGYSHYSLDNEAGYKLTQAGVDLVLNGHEHAYARNTLETTSTAAGTGSLTARKPGEAPTYVVGGSIYNYAYGLSSQDTSWNQVFVDLRLDPSSGNGGAINAPGVYNKIDVTNNSLTFTSYYQAFGAVRGFQTIDTFTITKPDDEITQPVGGGEKPDSVNFLFDSFDSDVKGQFVARFNWMTDPSITATELYYAKKADYDTNGNQFTNYALGSSELLDMKPMLEDAGYTNIGVGYGLYPRQSHKAETVTLEAGTEYVYSVGDGYRNMSDPETFTTPSSNASDGFSFVFFTDMQQGVCADYQATVDAYKNAGNAILNRALEQHPDTDFLLSGGDQVNFSYDTWEWDGFFEANQDIFSNMPVYLSEGNHEHEGDGNGNYGGGSWDSIDPTMRNLMAHYNPPHNGASYYGGGTHGTERMVAGQDRLQLEAENYYFIYGDTLFLVMEYSDLSSSARIKAQQDWMKSVVKNNPTTWKVAVMHKALFGYRMDAAGAREKGWPAAFDEAGVDMVMMGHDHIYVHTNPLTQEKSLDQTAYGDGTVYISCYSCNDDLRGSDDYSRNNTVDGTTYVEAENLAGYCYVSITPSEIRITAEGRKADGTWKTSENNVLVTNKPRSSNLNDWKYPDVPEEQDSPVVTAATISGIAMEGQSLTAAYEPKEATVKYQWEVSDNGRDGWTEIAGATRSIFTLKAEHVGKYLRCTVSGIGMYLGSASSAASECVTAMGGSGTAAVEISNAGQLADLAKNFGSEKYPLNGFYTLTADIDLNGVEFQPIGSGLTPFLGTFNGSGHTISNMSITSTEKGTGLFAYVGSSGRVANLNLVNAQVTGTGAVGLLAGALTGTVENCYVTGTVTGSSSGTGGLVGVLHAGTIRNCAVDVTAVSTSYSTGGLFGSTDYSLIPNGTQNTTDGNVVENNLILGTIGGPDASYVGGMIGEMAGGKGCGNEVFNGNVVGVTSVTAKKYVGRCNGYWSSSAGVADGGYTRNYVSTGIVLTGEGSDQTNVDYFSDIAPEKILEKQTYEDLGWDFGTAWEWDEASKLPVPGTIAVDAPGSKYLTVIASIDAGGVMDQTGNIPVVRGSNLTFTFSAKDKFFQIAEVLVDGVPDAAAMAAGTFTFTNIQTIHTIAVRTEPSGLQPVGRSPSVLGKSLTYDLADPDHMHINLDLGEGEAGVKSGSEDGYGISSIKAYNAGGEEIFDFSGCYWYPNKSMPLDNITLEICYDDMQKKVETYGNLKPGVYDVYFVFNDALLSTYVIPLKVVEGSGGGDDDDEFAYWTLTEIERAEKTSAVPEDAGQDASLYSLKGETVGYQIVVKAPADEDLTITGLTVSNLEGDDGGIDSKQMNLYREHFIFVEGSQHSDSQGGHNRFPSTDSWYADPLIPFVDPMTGEKPSTCPDGSREINYVALPYTVPAGENAVFFVDVNVPYTAEAGGYEGTYTVISDAGAVSGGVSLTVWDYKLQPGTQYSQFGGTGTGVTLNMLLKHGIGTTSGLNTAAYARVSPNGQLFNNTDFWGDVSWGQPARDMLDAPTVEEITKQIEDLGFTVGDGTMWVNYTIDEIETAYEEYISEDMLEWFDPADYDPDYTGDPAEFYKGSHELFRQKLYQWHKALSACGVSLEIVCRPYPDMLDDYDLWNEDHADEIAAGLLEEKQPGDGEPIVDIFVSLDSLYFTPYYNTDGTVMTNEFGDELTTEEMIRAAQKAGCEVWSYTALVQDDYSPTWSLDAPLTDYRMLPGFLNQAMGFTGTLNWRVDYDMSTMGNEWVLDDVDYQGNSLIDGTLAYSGGGAGLSGGQYVQSLRLKAIRSGFADYAYAEMLREEGEDRFVNRVVAQVAEDYADWSTDPEEIQDAKIALGEKLDGIGDTGDIHPQIPTGAVTYNLDDPGDIQVSVYMGSGRLTADSIRSVSLEDESGTEVLDLNGCYTLSDDVLHVSAADLQAMSGYDALEPSTYWLVASFNNGYTAAAAFHVIRENVARGPSITSGPRTLDLSGNPDDDHINIKIDFGKGSLAATEVYSIKFLSISGTELFDAEGCYWWPGQEGYDAGEYGKDPSVVQICYNDLIDSGYMQYLPVGSYQIALEFDEGSVLTVALKVIDSQSVPVSGVELDKDVLTLTVGETGVLTATVYPASASNKEVVWSSSNMAIATVDAYGLVRAVRSGTAVITVTAIDGGYTDSCKIIVDEGWVPTPKPTPVPTPKPDSGSKEPDTQPQDNVGEAKFPFGDVAVSAWYYESVRSAWMNGLIDGITDDQFAPEAELTVVQAIKLAAVLNQMYTEGAVTLKNGNPWYSTYVNYAVEHGIIEERFLSYTAAQMDAPATRAEFVHIFYHALPDSEYTAMNAVANGAIPDVKGGDSFADEIYTFYRAGILVGNDSKGTFQPAAQIKRSEVAAILIRMYDKTARKSLAL